MGERETPPPLPDLEPNMLEDGRWAVGNLQRDCNWMQALEGDIDTVHVPFLHGGHRTVHNTQPGTTSFYTAKQPAARYKLVDEEYGVSYGAYREAEPDTYYWRIAHFLFPFYTMTPVGALGVRKQVRAWVPMDDEHTMFWSMEAPGTRMKVGSGSVNHLPRTPLNVSFLCGMVLGFALFFFLPGFLVAFAALLFVFVVEIAHLPDPPPPEGRPGGPQGAVQRLAEELQEAKEEGRKELPNQVSDHRQERRADARRRRPKTRRGRRSTRSRRR